MNDVKIEHHPKFNKELKKFIKEHYSSNTNFNQTVNGAVKLIKKKIYEKEEAIIGPKHFNLAQGFGAHSVYWHKLVIIDPGMKKSQHPKCYLYADEEHFCFLCCDSHINNYKDSQLKATAKQRLKEMLQKWSMVACK